MFGFIYRHAKTLAKISAASGTLSFSRGVYITTHPSKPEDLLPAILFTVSGIALGLLAFHLYLLSKSAPDQEPDQQPKIFLNYTRTPAV